MIIPVRCFTCGKVRESDVSLLHNKCAARQTSPVTDTIYLVIVCGHMCCSVFVAQHTSCLGWRWQVRTACQCCRSTFQTRKVFVLVHLHVLVLCMFASPARSYACRPGLLIRVHYSSTMQPGRHLSTHVEASHQEDPCHSLRCRALLLQGNAPGIPQSHQHL
jgi:DNA-directed RNA polymerase subunit N (RpoN/RPB10)